MNWIVIAIIALLVLAGGIGYFVFKRRSAKQVLTPLPLSNRVQPAIFQGWISGLPGDINEGIARHDLWIHIPEAYGCFWRGRSVMTAPCLSGVLEPSLIQVGLDRRAALKTLNPNLKLLAQVGYTEGADETTDFPPDHPWWLRVNGQRVRGWFFGPFPAYLFNLDLPEVRQHCADCCATVMASGVFDGVFLDVFSNDDNHVDLACRVRLANRNAILIANLNYNICPDVVPYLDGVFMECGQVTSVAQWNQIKAALQFNERHVRQPAFNCLEISGLRADRRKLLAATCLALVHSNAYVLYADPGVGYASTHQHAWYKLWSTKLGRPIEGPREVADGTQRGFERGIVTYVDANPESSYVSYPPY